jgi:hypothetical protein
MEIDKIREILTLNNSFQNWLREEEQRGFLLSNNLLNKFSKCYDEEYQKLPYRLNLLDDLATNENAHSKFLIRLLQYKPALEDFLTFTNNQKDHHFYFDVSTLNKPILTYEKMRIDGLIRENSKYAIIIENKIHNAIEQEHQVGRYIEKCKALGFKIDQIFVLYLTKTDHDNHSDQTWGTTYKSIDFNRRYCKLSYKSKILPWLESYLKKISANEELIKSAVVQYIDHLKHFFNKKEIYKNMNVELEKFLMQELELSIDHVENLEVINKKITDVNKLKEQLEVLQLSSKNKLFEEWKIKLEADFNLEESQVFFQSKYQIIKTGVILSFHGRPFSVSIEHNFKAIYIGFGAHHTNKMLDSEIKEFLIPLKNRLSFKDEEPWWYGWNYTTFKDGYSDLNNLIKLVMEEIATVK